MPGTNHPTNREEEGTEALLQANEQLWSEILQRWSTEEELRQSEHELRNLSYQLLMAQESDRKRIAKELHDGLSQCLTAIKFSIENGLQQGLVRSGNENDLSVDRVLRGIQSAIEALHNISMNLYPSMLDDLGIIPTISWFCREFQTRNNRINLKTYIDIRESEIPAQLKPTIYRLIQEALNNVEQHSGAEVASLHLSQNDSGIELMVHDSGVGFDDSGLDRQSLKYEVTGITRMRWHTNLYGGTLSIRTESNLGTTIHAVWPLQE